jgi:MoaA/NifB/PqqE/SkfB family radical SAM enzyme
METHDMLAEIQKEDPRLRIHCISTATNQNLDEIRALTEYLYQRCPAMDHHNLAVIRGDRKDPSLLAPATDKYSALYDHIQAVWHEREKGRFGGVVEPMLQWAKIKTLEEKRQVVPCSAGVMTGVVYANGDVSVCELHKPLGNLREKTFREIWNSPEAAALRKRVACKECWCTTEVFLWPSIVFQPVPLARAAVGGKIWQKPGSKPVDSPIAAG